MDLHEAARAVHNQATFLAFAKSLQLDRGQAATAERETPASPHDLCGAKGGQNVTIDGFLERAIGWAEDSDFGETQGFSPDTPWRQFAAFLYFGKLYE